MRRSSRKNYLISLAIILTVLLVFLSTAALAIDFTFTTIDFPAYRINTIPTAINNRGEIVGWYAERDVIGPLHGFLLSNGNFTTIDFPGSHLTEPRGINDKSQIVGKYDSANNNFLLSEGSFTALPNFPGANGTVAYGINDRGQIVGSYSDAIGFHGFIASPVPEPSTILLLGSGLIGLLGFARRKFKK